MLGSWFPKFLERGAFSSRTSSTEKQPLFLTPAISNATFLPQRRTATRAKWISVGSGRAGRRWWRTRSTSGVTVLQTKPAGTAKVRLPSSFAPKSTSTRKWSRKWWTQFQSLPCHKITQIAVLIWVFVENKKPAWVQTNWNVCKFWESERLEKRNGTLEAGHFSDLLWT